MIRDEEFLEEEAHVAALFENRARRFRVLMDLSKSEKGVPLVLLEKERDLLGVAAIMWVAIHPLADEPNWEEQIRSGRAMIREGMRIGMQHAEEVWTQHLLSDEFKNNPEIKFNFDKPNLTLHKGGQDGKK